MGATAPEEYGYCFWWGDTVGYTRSGGHRNIFPVHYRDVTWVSSAGKQMDSSTFDYSACPTYGKSSATLQSEGWVDSTGNLAAAHGNGSTLSWTACAAANDGRDKRVPPEGRCTVATRSRTPSGPPGKSVRGF